MKNNRNKITDRLYQLVTSITVVITIVIQVGLAEVKLFERELQVRGGYVSEAASGWDRVFFITSLGFERFQRHSNEYGDFLTHNLQMRFTWDMRKEPKDAWAIEIHNAWAEFRLGLGRSLRIGHFQPYFGLEVIEDTHGTILQTLMLENAGYKHDWGVGFKTFLGPFDWRIGAQLGQGMSFHRYKRNYLFTTRIGTPDGRNTTFALSGLLGNVYSMASHSTMHGNQMSGMQSGVMKPNLSFEEHVHKTFPVSEPGSLVKKWRVGYDLVHSGPYMTLKNEAAVGKDDSLPYGGAMLQVEYPFSFLDDLFAQYQIKLWSQNLRNRYMSYIPMTISLSYTMLNFLTFRAAYEVTFLPFAQNEIENQKVLIQIYYFGT